MIPSDSGTATVAPQSAPQEFSRLHTTPSVFQCLVVSSCRQRQEFLALAAREEGWRTVVCANAHKAELARKRLIFKLAMIDLEAGQRRLRVELRDLTSRLVTGSDLLVVVCGHEGDAKEEIWARQLGAWLYLPGVSASSDVGMVCREGMAVARRLSVAQSVVQCADTGAYVDR